MHKLMHKGLKKKKKTKKGKKGAEEDEFDPEELERYRRERAEALEKATSEGGQYSGETAAAATSSITVKTTANAAAGSDEWQKFQALTAGVDSILKKTQGDLDRIKSTSFFQRKAPIVEEKKPVEDPEVTKNKARRFIGFDKDGNPVEQVAGKEEEEKGKLTVSEEGFVQVPEDDDEAENSGEEDIFDTTYVDVLQNIDVQLAYIPDSPTEEEIGDDPFDTTSADKVLKTVDKHGKKVVSLGNAVEVLAGRIDYISTCKISRPRKVTTHDLLLDDVEASEGVSDAAAESFEFEKTLLDDDSDLPDIPVNLTDLPPPIHIKPVAAKINDCNETLPQTHIDVSEFEVLTEKTILEAIPDLDDEFDFDGPADDTVRLDEAEDPFAEKESAGTNVQSEIIEASFETATFVDEEDPFDTTFADNLVPGKAELKFIEKELEEIPDAEVSISLTDPSGLNRDYETGLLTPGKDILSISDLLGGSATDLSQLTDQPIAPAEEITYVDPFDTSGIQESTPGQTELKFLEKELFGDDNKDSFDDDDFDPRKEETSVNPSFEVTFQADEVEAIHTTQERKPSRPEALGLGPAKSVAFELPTPSQRPDLLITSDEEKSIPSKPLTPYYSQKSFEETLPETDRDNDNVDPFDTSFVAKVTPGKTELKLIESELLKQETTGLTHSISEHDLNSRTEAQSAVGRRQSDFGTTSVRPKSLKFGEFIESLIEDSEETKKSVYQVNEDVHRKKYEPKRQESLLDAQVAVDAKPLTPRIESKITEDNDELSYVDPFDTSIASNILPGKAELKLLESELSQISPQAQPILVNRIDFDKVSQPATVTLHDDDDFDPRAESVIKEQDFLFSDEQHPGDKVLTPLPSQQDILDDSVDPFDTSFAAIGPGKTELKLLESELMDK